MGKRRQGPFLSFGVLWPDLRVHRYGQAKVWGGRVGAQWGPRGHHHRLPILSHSFSPNPTPFPTPTPPPPPTAISVSTPLFTTLTFCFTSPPHLCLLSSMVPLPRMAAKKSLRPFCTEGFEDLAPPFFFFIFFFFFLFLSISFLSFLFRHRLVLLPLIFSSRCPGADVIWSTESSSNSTNKTKDPFH